MTDPRIIPPGEVLPPKDLDERPARRNRCAPTDAEPKRKPGRRGGAVQRRFALFNAFVDLALARLGPVDVAVWLVLYRHGWRDGTVTVAVSDLERRTGYRDVAVRRALRRLREHGLIKRIKRGTLAGGPSVYRLNPPGSTEP